MRQIVFRVLAGLLAVAFGALLAFGDLSQWPLSQKFFTCVITVGFGLYALRSNLGERFIAAVAGVDAGAKDKSADEPDEPDSAPRTNRDR